MLFLNSLRELIPAPLRSFYHWLWAFLSAVFYGFPSRRLKVIGVTGTNGKTTTCFLIAKILEQAGYKVAMTSSLNFKIGKKELKNTLKMTMPGRGFLQRFLKEAVRSGCDFAVLEVTSEGISQHRHRFVDFEAVVFTNLSPEHIERHKGFENYREAKGKLFQLSKKKHIINVDDKNASYFLSFRAEKKFLYGIDDKFQIAKRYLEKDLRSQFIKAQEVETDKDFSSFVIGNFKFTVGLPGKFNIYNALAAITTSLSFGVSLSICKQALEKVKGVPGRMERVIEKPFEVYVDYAFTPNALTQVYKTIRGQLASPNSKLICVLGACGGGRDKWKRPVLGRIARQFCQRVIVTNEDPYDEDPMEIINMVAKGAGDRAEKILDRRQAIRRALDLARAGDKVIVTGKGAESWIQVKGGKKIPWDDRQVVREEFQKLMTQKIRSV